MGSVKANLWLGENEEAPYILIISFVAPRAAADNIQSVMIYRDEKASLFMKESISINNNVLI